MITFSNNLAIGKNKGIAITITDGHTKELSQNSSKSQPKGQLKHFEETTVIIKDAAKAKIQAYNLIFILLFYYFFF